jgi:tetratricopeptide (TPR) repeat protein
MKANFFVLIFCSLLFSCDFSSTLHKQIIKAQDYIKQKDYNKAAEVYEFILTKKIEDNIFVKINFQLGEIYSIYLNKPLKAIENYDAVIKNKRALSWQVRALERKADILFSYTKNYEDAGKAYKKLMDFKPKLDKYDLYEFRLGKINIELSKYDEAHNVFESISKNNSHEFHVESFFELGMAYFYKEEWKNAIKTWFEYIKRERKSDRITMTKFLIANAYETNENLKEAYNIYYSLLGEYPNTKVIKNRLEAVFKRRVARKR